MATRPFITLSAAVLRERFLAARAANDAGTLAAVHHELTFRDSVPAMALLDEVNAALQGREMPQQSLFAGGADQSGGEDGGERGGGGELGEAGSEAPPGDIEPEDHGGPIKPWDPTQIRIQTVSYGLKQLVDEIDDETIDLNPDFQRLYVWKDRQKSLLLESIFLGIPLPVFYFNQEPDGRMQVVDGVQRLTTIFRFFKDGLVPMEFEYLRQLRGVRYSTLPVPWRRRFNQTQLVVHVIDPATPAEVKFDIFRRINTGGSPLAPQEIRHCMSKSRSRTFLSQLAELKSFKTALSGALTSNQRMEDRELVLRFVALRLPGLFDEYSSFSTFDGFLMDATRRLDDAAKVPQKELNRIRAEFEKAMALAQAVFGDRAFRRWQPGRRGPLNKAMFESWASALADADPADAQRRKADILDALGAKFHHDAGYVKAISQATGDPLRFGYRVRVARELLGLE